MATVKTTESTETLDSILKLAGYTSTGAGDYQHMATGRVLHVTDLRHLGREITVMRDGK